MSTYWVNYKGTRFPIRRGETILGRSPYCSIVISDDLVSREHCALRLTTQGLTVADLNSTNGITVNGKRVRGAQVLAPGDVLGVGTARLEVLRLEAAMRSASSTTRSELQGDKRQEAPITLAQASSLELIDALINSAQDSNQRQAVAPTIKRAVDELAARMTEAAAPSAAAGRLTGMVNTVADWFPRGDYDGWRRETVAQLARLTE